jgi:hypothetical protein
MRRVDYVGKKFGKLVVLSRTDRVENSRSNCFLFCRCECGKEKEFRYCNLRTGTTTSCGCSQKEQVSKRSRKEPGTAVKRSVWNYYLRNAADRNISWNLSFERFCELILKPCHYCGKSGVTFTKMKYGDNLSHNGVDRFYNDQGYTDNNSVTCCKRCNMAKSNMSPQDFEEWIQDVYGHLFEGDL